MNVQNFAGIVTTLTLDVAFDPAKSTENMNEMIITYQAWIQTSMKT